MECGSRNAEVGKWIRCALSFEFVESRYERDARRMRQINHFYIGTPGYLHLHSALSFGDVRS